MEKNKMQYLVGGVIVLLIVIVAIYFVNGVMSNKSGGGLYGQGNISVPVSLTDPPEVPSGTSALVVTYSSVGVHLLGAGNDSGWIYSNTSGTLNLMSLVNVSQAIATVTIPANATINV